MKTKLLLLALFVSVFSWGQSIFTNPITGTNPNTSSPYTTGQTVDANLTVSGIGRGPGAIGASANDRYNANSWNTPVLDPDAFFELILTPAVGFQINFADFIYTGQRSGTGPTSFAFRSSVDGYVSNIGTPTATGATIDLSGAAYQGVTSAITFRIYGWGTTNVGGTFSINDFTFNGTVTPVGGCSDPVEQAIDIVVSNPSTTGFTVSWTPAVTAFGTMVVVRPAASPLVTPTSGTMYTANAAFGSGANLGSNNFVVYKGTGSSVNITGLLVGNPYVITIYSYNSPDCYSSTPPESLTRYTLALEPGSQATGVTSCGTPTLNSVTINFPTVLSLGITNCIGYLIIMREGAAPNPASIEDGVFYANGAVVGNATVVAYVNNAAFTRTVNLLNSGSTYHFMLIPYFGSTAIRENLNYRISGTPLGLNCATTASQEINVRGIIGVNPTILDGDNTPSGLDNTLFATVAIGSSQDKVFRIENTGNLDLEISNIGFTGGQATSFSIVGGGSITYPFLIPGGAFFDFTVRFAPLTPAGLKTTTLNIANNDSNENPYNFTIQGTATVTPLVDINVTGNGNTIPDNSLFPLGVNFTAFGVATVGVTTVVRTFTIENLGTSVLNLTGTPSLISITGTHASMFSVTAQPAASIAGGSSTTFEVTFNPTSLGAKNATISIANSDPDENPYNFNISGNAKGTNNMYVYGNGNDVIKGATTTATTNFTNFGPVAVATGVRQNTFVVTNLSGTTRFFSNVTISGSDASMFTVIANPTSNGLGNGNSTSFTINFTPTSIGVKNATVSFNIFENSARTIPEPIDPVFTFAVSGLGTNFVTCSNGPVTTIVKQDFETPITAPNWTFAETYFSESANNGIRTIGGGTYNNGSGAVNAFASPGARSFQFRGFPDAGESSSNSFYQTAVVTFASVDTQLYRDINFSMNVGAYRTGSQGLDVNDFVMVEMSTDGGVNWSAEAIVRGFSNSRWSFAATGVFDAYYTGTNTGATVDTRNGNAELTNGFATFNVRNLPSVPSLQIRVTLFVDRDEEIWAIDNVRLEGRVPNASVWNSPLDPGIWSPAPPTNTTAAIINGNFNTATNGNFTSCECIINNGFTVTVEGAGSFIQVQNDLRIGTGSTLEVLDDASLVMKNDFGTITNNGTVRMTRETSPFKRFDYVYWSSPLTDANITTTFNGWRLDRSYEFVTQNFEDLLSINNLGIVTASVPDTFDDYAPWAWTQYVGNMMPGKGYAIMAPTTGTFPRTGVRTFTGIGLTNTFNNGIITVPLTLSANNTVTTDDYNLVGNPYPSAISANDFINANLPNISGTLYFWTHNTAIANTNQANNAFNHSTNDYAMYNLIGGIATAATVGTPCGNCPSSQIPTGFIASGQGFLVEAENDTSEVVFNNTMRNTGFANDYFYRFNPNSTTTNNPAAVVMDKIWLNFENNDGFFSQQLIGYTDTATNQYDKGYDGVHNNALNYVNFYSLIGSEMYRIQGRSTFDVNDEVPLGYTTAVAGNFTISTPKQEGILNEMPVYLEDKATGYVYDLKMNPFTFETTEGTFNDRFVLKYTNSTLGAADFEAAATQVVAFGSKGLISIHSKQEMIASVTVLDILGKVILKKDNLSSNEVQFANPSKANQAFVLKITLANGITVTKKVVL